MKTFVLAATGACAMFFSAAQAAVYANEVLWHDNDSYTNAARENPDNAKGAPDQVGTSPINFLSLGLSTDTDGLAYAFFGFPGSPFAGGDVQAIEVTFGCNTVVDGGCSNHPEAVYVYYGETIPGSTTDIPLADLASFTSNLNYTFAGTATNGTAVTETVTITEQFSYILLVDATKIVFPGSSSTDGFDIDAVAVNPIPLPGAALLMGSGLVLAAARRRRTT
ncbi:MAG: VPLPA-CTERM sorting domain-containing protein [Pseudomonadota bacterium]